MSLPLHGLHAAAGAVFEERLGQSLPSWYGPGPEAEAVAREYGAAREGAALVDLSERGVLAVTGPQRQKFLHSVLSNAVEGCAPGQGCLASLMDVKGHLVAFLRVLVTADAVLLEMPADRLSRIEELLLHYRVAAPVRFAPRPVVVLGLLGPAVPAVLREAGAALVGLPPEAHVAAEVGGAGVLLTRATDIPGGGLVIHVPPEQAARAWRAVTEAGARPLGRRALDALRVEAGRAWYGTDVTEENLLHETGLVAEYHSSTKGCYVGQEVVARLEARGGHVNRRLRGLTLTAPSPAGSPILAASREVGRLTTAAVSPRLGPVAMGYVHRSHFEPGTAVEVEGRPARVVALPFP